VEQLVTEFQKKVQKGKITNVRYQYLSETFTLFLMATSGHSAKIQLVFEACG